MAPRFRRWPRLWFTLRDPVDARTYFRDGADAIISRIRLRVLAHVKTLFERH